MAVSTATVGTMQVYSGPETSHVVAGPVRLRLGSMVAAAERHDADTARAEARRVAKEAAAAQALVDEAAAQAQAEADRRAVAERQAARASRAAQGPRAPPAAGGHPRDPAIEQCIIDHENGGSYDKGTNPTHFGRYQFARETWARYGGDPATWGSASPEEQDRVFARAVAENGYNDWTPYNPC